MRGYSSRFAFIIIIVIAVTAFIFIFGEFGDVIKAEPVMAEIEYKTPKKDASIPESTTPRPHPPKVINVEYIYQDDHYPNGCESVSTVMALRHLGFDITVDEFIDQYLDTADIPKVGETGADPRQYYLGDPRSVYAWGCYSPVIVNALSKFLDPGEYTVANSFGNSLDTLCRRYIDAGIPVIVWATVDMQDASGEEYIARWTTEDGREIEYNKRLHCMLLVGYDDHYYYFNDPKHYGIGANYVAYTKSKAEKAYSLLNMQSIAIYEK